MTIMEYLNVVGIETTVLLQSRLPSTTYLSVLKTLQLTDPSLILTFYFPILSALNFGFGIHMVSALIYCDAVLMAMHWGFGSERPFWWVHESTHYLKTENFPQVSQFPFTCETGPATPSAATALNAAAFFIMSKALISGASHVLYRFRRENLASSINKVVWICYGSLIGIEMTSHVYLASHFPYQCILGALVGIGAAFWTTKTDLTVIQKRRKISYSNLAILTLIGISAAVGSIYSEVYSDSILKAIRWCTKREFIVINPTPLYPVSRFLGLSLGVNLATLSAKFNQKDFHRFSWKMKLSSVILALSVGQSMSFILQLLFGLPIWLYYIFVFVVHTVFVYFILNFLPTFVMRCSGVKSIKLQTIIAK